VYAGPHILVAEEEDEIICISGIWPPWGRPSLMSASEISQLEKVERLETVSGADMIVTMSICVQSEDEEH